MKRKYLFAKGLCLLFLLTGSLLVLNETASAAPEKGSCVRSSDCNDQNPCTRDVCLRGRCSNRPGNRGTICRRSAGTCDVAEKCDGRSASCPADTFKPATTTCRTRSGVCDVAERCTGTSAQCPDNSYRTAGTTCRTASGTCDVAETCSGSSASCPANSYAPSGTTCRTATGTCDVAETCSGSSASCPSNSYAASGTTCRVAAGPCDKPESCSGRTALCPADSFRSSTTVCRTAAGTCDVAERCTGSGASCPDNRGGNAGVVCRGAAGVCDVAEVCDGSSTTCPTNSFVTPGSLICRAGSGACNPPERCAGSASCPADTGLISTCQSGDGCCPTGCSYSGFPADRDCPAPRAVCGNGVIEGSEECDEGMSDLYSNTCWYCRLPRCGDGRLNNNEQCDGRGFGGISCSTFGFNPFSSRLNCTDGCRFDFSECHGNMLELYGTPPTTPEIPEDGCGNYMMDGDEACDGGHLQDRTCRSFMNDSGFVYYGGSLGCNDSCTGYDTSGCYGRGGDMYGSVPPTTDLDPNYQSRCGNNFVDEGEECEDVRMRQPWNSPEGFLPVPPTEDCEDNGFRYGIMSCNGADCTWSTARCTSESCGNGTVDTDNGEVCDGYNLGGRSCRSFGYTSGNLLCVMTGDQRCGRFNTQNCYMTADEPYSPPTEDPYYEARCGNLYIDEGEVCEVQRWSTIPTCRSLGYYSGALPPGGWGSVVSCVNCRPDTRNCYGVVSDMYGSTPPATDPYYVARCGNSFLDEGEQCDRALNNPNYYVPHTETCAMHEYDSGTLYCSTTCGWNLSGCHNDGDTWCGDRTINGDEVCEGTDLGGVTCASLGYFGGSISCEPGCLGLNTRGCYGNVGDMYGTTPPTTDPYYQPSCRNGFLDTGEECENHSFTGTYLPTSDTCITRGFRGGYLYCSSCTTSTNSCYY